MPSSRRSRRRRGRAARLLDLDRLHSLRHTETGPGGLAYQVQYLRASQKEYVCPGCLRRIPPGTPNVVAWPEDPPFGVEGGAAARRHWHVACWKRGLRPN